MGVPWLKTFLGSSTSAVLKHLKHDAILPRAVGPVLYTISTPESDDSVLSELVDTLSKLSEHTVGCVSAPLTPTTCALSIALFDSTAKTFRSEIPGIPPTQVGRWPADSVKKRGPWQGEMETSWSSIVASSGSWSDIWRLASTSRLDQQLPPELEILSNAASIIYLSDAAPQGFMHALTKTIKPDCTLGLIARPTPFLNGRPFTLFRNGGVYTGGAVGVALSRLQAVNPTCTINYHGFKSTRELLTIDAIESNMIHSFRVAEQEVTSTNPAQQLVNDIANQGLSKSDALYIGRVDEHRGSAASFDRIYRITSGDPSRGSVALDLDPTDSGLAAGEQVKFLHRPPTQSVALLNEHLAQSHCAIRFSTQSTAVPLLDSSEIREMSDLFYSFSEGGIIYGHDSPWRCAVPGATASISWTK